jgi:Protein of unknown function (DUF4012)
MYKPPDTGNDPRSPFMPNGSAGYNVSPNSPSPWNGNATSQDKPYSLHTLPSTPAVKPPPGYGLPVGARPIPQAGNLGRPGQPVPPPFNAPPNMPGGGPPFQGAGKPAKKPRCVTRAVNKYASLSLKGKILVGILVIALLVPSVAGVFEGINAYVLYSQAMGGIDQLKSAGNQFSGIPSGSTSEYFSVTKLTAAQQHMQAAQNDFQALSNELNTDGSIGLLGDMMPQQISTARALARIGVDTTMIATHLLGTAIQLSPSIVPVLKASQNQSTSTQAKPILNQTGMNEISADITYMLPLVNDMTQNSHSLYITSLPISKNQQQAIASAINLLPAVDYGLNQVHQNISELTWILGIGSPRNFLVEPMDRAELRATGGFTGQFGLLNVSGGDVGKLQLQNIGAYEESFTNAPPVDPTMYADKIVGATASYPYSEWWPIGNFGMRDANLSADLPESAQIIMNAYDNEFGTQPDGFISFTPYLIEDILNVTGPITIAKYNQTITAQNLQDKLHYYQLNNTGIRQEEIIEHINDPQLARKAFTQRVTSTLISKVEHSSSSQILKIIDMLGTAMKEKNLQIYMTNPQVEALIAKYGSTDTMDRSTSHDGVYVVQDNLSANKASQYVTTAVQDTVTLDAAGDATHNMQITLDYQEKGSVYGPDTYRDYIRVYVPPTSILNSGNGFEQLGSPYCGDPSEGYVACNPDVYGDGSLVCATSPTIGPVTAYNGLAPSGYELDAIGGPTNTTSDEQGRNMYAGWVSIPPNCTMKVSLSWTVPAMGNQYSLMFQPQASVMPQLNLTIQDPSCSSSSSLHYSGTSNGEDEMFTVAKNGSSCSLQRKLQ